MLDLLNFLYLTGCRPIEARILEAKHIHDDLIIFPADESKGEVDPRVIFLPPEAKEIVDRLRLTNVDGYVFRNSRGNSWTKHAVKCAMARITEKVGFRVIAYGTRHSYATNALPQGGVDPVSLAHLMGTQRSNDGQPCLFAHRQEPKLPSRAGTKSDLATEVSGLAFNGDTTRLGVRHPRRLRESAKLPICL